MAIKKYKPTTNGRRGMSTLANEELTGSKPTKSLLVKKTKTGGRNNQGRMTVQHIGGGAKQKYRLIDFKRNKFGVPARVASIEYDPNRSANIALLVYKDGEKAYIIAPKDLVDDDFTMQDTHAKVVYDISKGFFDGQYVVGSIVNIKEGNITRDFVARGYVVIDGVTYYTEETIARNISSVADAFIADEASGYADLDADKQALVNKWAKAND